MKNIGVKDNYVQELILQGEHQQQDFKFEISDARKIAKSLSAFANTDGGRLLIGIKDNGKIAGVRSEEEAYMIESAANVYCSPEVRFSMTQHRVEGKVVLDVSIPEAEYKPVCAKNEENKLWA
jgi:predicted HTH transcriptional regulator